MQLQNTSPAVQIFSPLELRVRHDRISLLVHVSGGVFAAYQSQPDYHATVEQPREGSLQQLTLALEYILMFGHARLLI